MQDALEKTFARVHSMTSNYHIIADNCWCYSQLRPNTKSQKTSWYLALFRNCFHSLIGTAFYV